MGVSGLFTRSCIQTCVYWGNPVEDGYGGVTYDDPVEILCRWEDKMQILGAVTGGEITGFSETSRAIVYLTQDVDQDGLLYLGTLASLDAFLDSSSGSYIDPRSIEGTGYNRAHIIKRFEKTPAFGSTTEFLRKAFLSPWLT